jgi:hypothetical protein
MFNRRILAAIFGGLGTVALAAQVHAAASTSTPPLLVNTGSGIICAVTNVGNKPIEVFHQIVNSNGVVADEGTPTTIAPGAIYNSGGIVAPAIIGPVYCRVPGFTSRKVRVTTCLMTAIDIVNGVGRCLDMTTAP